MSPREMPANRALSGTLTKVYRPCRKSGGSSDNPPGPAAVSAGTAGVAGGIGAVDPVVDPAAFLLNSTHAAIAPFRRGVCSMTFTSRPTSSRSVLQLIEECTGVGAAADAEADVDRDIDAGASEVGAVAVNRVRYVALAPRVETTVVVGRKIVSLFGS